MQAKILNIPPAFIPAAVGNLLNCALGSLSGPVGFTMTQPYLVIKRIRIMNLDSAQHIVTLYKGATGGSAAGTQWGFAATPIPGGSSVESFEEARFDSGDFLTGICDTASVCIINIDADICLAG
jgi:hypothetical protein